MFRKIFILLFCIVFIGGCAGIPTRTHSQFTGYFEGVEKTITVLPITIKLGKITAGGIPERMDEWEIRSDALFKAAIMESLDRSPRIEIRFLEESSLVPDLKVFLDQQAGLYRAISESIIMHTYMGGLVFPLKLKNFDYTLGSQFGKINDFISTDTFLFISGNRTYWTGGRVLLGVCGVLMGAATGVTVVPGSVPDWVSAALVDSKTGNIIWFRYMGMPNSAVGDLRDEKAVSQTVSYLFKGVDK